MATSSVTVDERLALLLNQKVLRLGEGSTFVYENAAAFARLCNGPNKVEQIDIDPFTYPDDDDYEYDYDDDAPHVGTSPFQSYEAWNHLGAGVGKLKGIRTVRVGEAGITAEAVRYIMPDWEAVGLVLRNISNNLCLDLMWLECDDVDVDSLAPLLHENAFIREFKTPIDSDWTCFAPLFSILPSLQAVELTHLRDPEEEEGEFEEIRAQHADMLGRLLRLSTLRSVRLRQFVFTEQCFAAVTNALRNGSPITHFGMEVCRFPFGGSNRILHALQENKAVHTFDFDALDHVDASFCDAMIRLLLVNTTLTLVKLNVHRSPHDVMAAPEHQAWLAPLFQVLAYANRTLKSLEVCDISLTDERTCAALYRMIEKNPVLENLVLNAPVVPDPAEFNSWRNVLLALQTNTTLASLAIRFMVFGGDHHVFSIETIASLETNTTLESLEIATGLSSLSCSEYLHVLDSLKPSPTPKKLVLGCEAFTFATREETEQLVSIVKKNCWLEHLDDNVEEQVPNVANLLRLNRAGRRYLVEGDTPSPSKGVAVLTVVSDSLDCIFTHLLENPTLCDIEKDEGGKEEGDLRQSKRLRVGKAESKVSS